MRELTCDTAIYGLGGVALRFAPLLQAPIYTRSLSRVEFGAGETITALLLILTALLPLGTDSAMNALYFREPSQRNRQHLSGSWLLLLLGIAAAAGVCFSLAAPVLLLLLSLPSDMLTALRVALAGFPFALLSYALLELQRLTFSPWKYVAIAATATAASLLIGPGLVVFLHAGLVGMFAGVTGGNLIGFAVGTILSRDDVHLRWRWADVKRLLAFGFPLTIAILGNWSLGYANRIILAHLSLQSVAIFAAGAKVAQVVSLLTAAFTLAWGPFAAAHAAQEGDRSVYADVFLAYTALASWLVLALAAFGPLELTILAPGSYAGANSTIGLLAAGIAITGAWTIMAYDSQLTEGPRHVAWTTLTGGVVAAVLGWVMASRFGYGGVAIASLLGSVVPSLLLYPLVRRHHPEGYGLPRALPAPLLALGVGVLVMIEPATSAWGRAGRVAGVVCFAVFVGAYVRWRRAHPT